MGSEDGRRKLLKALGLVGAGAAIQSQWLPAAWIKPVMDAVVPSAHANDASTTPTASPALPSPTSSVTPAPSPTSSITPTPAPSPTSSITPTPTPSPTASITPTPSPTPSASPIPLASPTPTPSPQPIIFKDRFQTSGP